jgi:hypothetical protein
MGAWGALLDPADVQGGGGELHLTTRRSNR